MGARVDTHSQTRIHAEVSTRMQLPHLFSLCRTSRAFPQISTMGHCSREIFKTKEVSINKIPRGKHTREYCAVSATSQSFSRNISQPFIKRAHPLSLDKISITQYFQHLIVLFLYILLFLKHSCTCGHC